jgi:capsular exopolysaccharide synthesis family protein
MDLKYYLSILWGNKWIIVSAVLIVVTFSLIGTLIITPTYSATTILRVATASIGSISYYDYASADRLMNTYTEIATSRPILEELAKRVNMETLPDVEITPISYTELIEITVNHHDPYLARNAANALAEILIEQSQELYSGGDKSTAEILGEQLILAEDELNQARNEYETRLADSPNDTDGIEKASMVVDLKTRTYESLLEQYEAARLRELLRANIITVVEPAALPLKPSQPNKALIMALSLIVGIMGGLGVIYLVEYLNPRLHTIDQVEELTELSVIGKIPSIRYKGLLGLYKRKSRPNSIAFKESFQKLQAKITQQKTNGNGSNVILITSAVPGEGKSTMVTNLAIAMARTGQKVVAVDCDMRRPTLSDMNDLPNDIGLSTVLNKQITPVKAIQKTQHPNLFLLTSGPIVQNPMELLGSSQMKTLITSLADKYDTVLLDAPAMLPVGDALVLAPLVNSTLLVIRQDISKEASVREACKQLFELNTPVIGAVINEAKQNGSYYYYKNKSSP